MTATAKSASSAAAPRDARVRLGVSASLLAVALALVAAVAGLGVDRVYAGETTDWRGQSRAQDLANLLVFPALAAAAIGTRRGSSRAHLVWMGLLIYSAYTFAIYAFALHFGPLFLVHVAILGLSATALVLAVATVDATEVARATSEAAPVIFAGRLMIGVGVLFAALWLSEDFRAIAAGTTPQTVEDAGLLTNPVHVLDLALLLPAVIAAGIAIRRRVPWALCAAPALLTALVALGVGIVAIGLGDDGGAPVAAVMAVLILVLSTTLVRLLAAIRR